MFDSKSYDNRTTIWGPKAIIVDTLSIGGKILYCVFIVSYINLIWNRGCIFFNEVRECSKLISFQKLNIEV